MIGYLPLAKLQTIMPAGKDRAARFIVPLNLTLVAYEINTPVRIAAFLAQIAVESGELRYTKEIWGNTPAQQRYEGRKDLGNTEAGDGKRFLGRGLIQLTGRANHQACGDALGLDLISMPQVLEQPLLACLSAGWFWESRGLNKLADANDVVGTTKRINGGTTALAKRAAYFSTAMTVLTL